MIRVVRDKKYRWLQTAILGCAIAIAEAGFGVGAGHCLIVSPGRIEVSVPASESYDGILSARNNEKKAVDVNVRVEDWHKAVEGIEKAGRRGLTWLKVSPSEFVLREDELKEIKIEVSVPQDAEGELNGMIFLSARPQETGVAAIGVNTSIGIPIYVMVKGTEKFSASVEELKLISGAPLQLAVVIRNSGNVHVRPEGTIELKKRGVKVVLPLNEYNYPVLPDSSRAIEIRPKKQLEPGDYRVDIKMGFADRSHTKRTRLRIQ